jgi:hypothetical protein
MRTELISHRIHKRGGVYRQGKAEVISRPQPDRQPATLVLVA